jgi:hypothetical protein
MKSLRLVCASVLSVSALAAGASPAEAQTCTNGSGSCMTVSNNHSGGSAVGVTGSVAGLGTGLQGLALSGGYGVYGQGNGASAIGVEGFNPSGGVAVAGIGSGPMGIGLRGFTNTGNGTGVQGVTTNGMGVQGTAANGTGVFGTAAGGIGVSAQLTGVAGAAGAALFASAPAGSVAGSFSGKVNISGDTTITGKLTVTGTINGVVVGSSDARLKEDVKDARYGLAELMQLRPVSFKWKDKRSPDLQRGFIAQELQQVFPELVSTDTESGMLQVNYLGLLPVAIKAIRDQQEVIRRQEARLEALERDRHPTMLSSLLSPGLGGGLALGLLPMGLVFGLRRRRDRA